MSAEPDVWLGADDVDVEEESPELDALEALDELDELEEPEPENDERAADDEE